MERPRFKIPQVLTPPSQGLPKKRRLRVQTTRIRNSTLATRKLCQLRSRRTTHKPSSASLYVNLLCSGSSNTLHRKEFCLPHASRQPAVAPSGTGGDAGCPVQAVLYCTVQVAHLKPASSCAVGSLTTTPGITCAGIRSYNDSYRSTPAVDQLLKCEPRPSPRVHAAALTLGTPHATDKIPMFHTCPSTLRERCPALQAGPSS